MAASISTSTPAMRYRSRYWRRRRSNPALIGTPATRSTAMKTVYQLPVQRMVATARCTPSRSPSGSVKASARWA